MAAKKVTTKPVEKTTEAAVKTTAPKAEEKKTEVKAVEKTEVKAEVKAEEVKPVEKKTAGRKPAAKKTTAKKAELKTSIHVQFAEQSYSQEDLLKIAKDVWKYDLKQKARALTSVELYVKPEERMAYYVMNKEFTGSFYI